ncbi:hypothetical protein ABZV93_27315 [Actinopolymorpha sp. NPDC004070]|uniref:hypothetical protein n=1 Tax=Actinopolymorpha sp. NPDC004070 TaxID=3154548 RepID=UPI0033BE160C
MNAATARQWSPALGRAFDRIRVTRAAAAGADAAEEALTEALRPVVDSNWPEVAWRFGVLTATGYPVEMAWASRDVALRWTCEVAGPEVPEADRLRLAQQAAAATAGSRPDLRRWSKVQDGRRLRWGAWLGLRQLDGSRRAKVYLELPSEPSYEGAPEPWADAGLQLASRVLGLTWRMAGVNDDGSVELYARVPELSWSELAAAASLVGHEDRLVSLVGNLITRDQVGRRVVLPRPSGLSLVLAPWGTPMAFTWFTIAKSVWADDEDVRAAVLRTTALVVCRSDSTGLYQALSSGPDDGRWRHGMVGVGVDRAGGTWLQAGLRPT